MGTNLFMDALNNKDNYIVTWVDPVETLSSTGDLRTGVQESRMSIRDAIDSQRRKVALSLKERMLEESIVNLSDEDMLYDFLLVNYATIRIGRIGE